MKPPFLATLALAVTTQMAHAGYFEHENWATVKIGEICHVFTLGSARDTSGTLIFSFPRNGYNSSFEYRYAPYPGETGAPWGPDDSVVLSFDDEETWIGDEMALERDSHGDFASLTSGFVPEVVTSVRTANHSVDVAIDRVDEGEIWLYGTFSAAGFSAALGKAGEWCQFDPAALPES
ncbi:hypothetical protein [Celeribacter sp.]|uniref:hypothetical protein n=1 Tax=Celeribacter sp. TaxID=1890673 RepID=UPI003A93AE15